MENKVIQEITIKDVLISEKNKVTKEIGKMQIDIAVLEKTDPQLIVQKEVLSRDRNGDPLSHRDITAKQVLENYRSDLQGHKLRLTTIKQLIEQEEE